MSSQKGNVARSRPQRHQNTFSFKNDKFDKSVQTKKINAKLHDGVCQHCKEVLEWRVKYSKYKPLSKPKKCVKCLQKTGWNPHQSFDPRHTCSNAGSLTCCTLGEFPLRCFWGFFGWACDI
uniref:Chromosome 1 C9orf85 homolog n=1 Tax=Sus scrofa TaxID=9823 RepID=A0A8W4FB46_PIG